MSSLLFCEYSESSFSNSKSRSRSRSKVSLNNNQNKRSHSTSSSSIYSGITSGAKYKNKMNRLRKLAKGRSKKSGNDSEFSFGSENSNSNSNSTWTTDSEKSSRGKVKDVKGKQSGKIQQQSGVLTMNKTNIEHLEGTLCGGKQTSSALPLLFQNCDSCSDYKDRVGKLEWALMKIQTSLMNDCDKTPKGALKDELHRILNDPWVNLGSTQGLKAPFKFQRSLFPDYTQTQTAESGFEKTPYSHSPLETSSESPPSRSPDTEQEDETLDTDLKYRRLQVDFDVLSKLGTGGFGSVLKARHKLDGKLYAVKEISLAPLDMEREKQTKEVEILCELVHPHIVRYYSSWFQFTNRSGQSSFSNSTSSMSTSSHGVTFEKSGSDLEESSESGTGSKTSASGSSSSSSSSSPTPLAMYIQMELCGSNLREAIDRGLPENPGQVWTYLKQIIAGLEYMHGKGVIHRDLKPANILITTCNTIKIGDFGLSTKKLFSEPLLDGGKLTEEGMTMNLGTSFYIAPEVRTKLRNKSKTVYDNRSDIYSLGVIVVEMLHTFQTQMERHHILTEVCAPEVKLPSELEYKLFDSPTQILKSCLNHAPCGRPSLIDLETNFAVSHDCALMLFHPDEVTLNWSGLSSSASRHIKYLRVYEKPRSSIILTDRFFNDLTISPILEYRTAATKSKSTSSQKPRILFHFPRSYASALCISETADEMKRAASFVKKCVQGQNQNQGQGQALTPKTVENDFLQKIYQALAEKNRKEELQLALENFQDFIQTCKSRASFVCAVLMNSKGKDGGQDTPDQEVTPSPWGENLRIPFDYGKLEKKLRSKVKMDPNSSFADALQLSLKSAGFLDAQYYFTKFWLQACADGTMFCGNQLADLPQLEGLTQGNLLELLRDLYFDPYFAKFSRLLLKNEIVNGQGVGQTLKICAIENLL